jgi:class 3 adenylate cyclase/predicted ATPase
MTAPDEVAGWLDKIGLPEYAPIFAEHAIDREILADLNDQDLKDLGIPLGHRKTLLKAIAALSPADETSPPRPAGARAQAERRQLTVLFCDLVGSTALSAQLDPEDMRELIHAYQDLCAGVITRFEGYVARFIGDGLLAYFGWPQAHEDDAERAIRAGLALVGTVAGLEAAGRPLAVRVGIATGLVVVGDLIGRGAARRQAVVGETPNLAARLQALAEPGSIVISGRTRRLVGGLFELADLGPQRLKGFAEPPAAFRVVGEGRTHGRFEALRGQRLTPLVGREPELAMLMQRWASARNGNGQVVLLAGEAGIGKSRVVRALRERLGDEPYTPLSCYCSPYHTNSALHPVIGLLERAARLDRGDRPEEQLAKLEALLARSSERLDEALPLLAALLELPTPELRLAPEVQKQRTLQALVDQLAGLAEQQPVLVLYEDMHWIDPSTLELLTLVVERVRRLRVLVLLTFRPEFQPPWTSHAHVTTLMMSRLGRRQGADLVARVTGGKLLPAVVVEQIVARTDGVPLFVEELTKTVLESGLLAEKGDHYELVGSLPPLAIPATLHDSLMARLDRLGPVKEVAQIGAVIGREFSHELLVAVAGRPQAQLQGALERLVASELVFRRGAPPEATYSFKHALVQEAAYQSLLKSKRQQLHGRIAATLEQQFPEVGASEPELLAHHATRAGALEKAVRYWQLAGEKALERSANAEAAGHLAKGLDLLGDLPEPAARRPLELELRLALGPALIATRGQTAGAVGANYGRARTLAGEIGEDTQAFRALFGLWQFHLLRAEVRTARALSEQCAALARRRDDRELLLGACRALGAAHYYLGEFVAARATLAEGVALAHDLPQRWQAPGLLADPRVTCRSYLSRTLWTLGYPDRARALGDEALALAEAAGHPFTLANNLGLIAGLRVALRDVGGAARLAGRLIGLASEQGFPYWLANGLLWRGWSRVGSGETAAGLADLEESVARFRADGNAISVAHGLLILADAYRQAGRPEEGLRTLATIEPGEERRHAAEWHRLAGDLLALTGRPDAAAARYRQALACARAQSAKAFELRAATALARLCHARGRRAEAHALLAPLCAWFTEGLDTTDLEDAKALLDELASAGNIRPLDLSKARGRHPARPKRSLTNRS